MHRKKFSIQKSLLVLFFTLLIFFSGIYIGKIGDQAKIENLNELYDDLRLETLGTEIEFELIESSICESDDFSVISERLNDLAVKLDYMENNLGFNDERVIRLKKYYFTLEMKHWLLANKQIEQCNLEPNIDNSVILYFYSNSKECVDCSKQGTVLSYMKRNYPHIKIYSFDVDLELSALDALKKVYGVQDYTPSLVINEEYYEGYLDALTLKKFIENQNKTE
ncbi:MAG: hypothetical protein AB7V77_00565 [Candidatus Woesearchaeota archaeon]